MTPEEHITKAEVHLMASGNAVLFSPDAHACIALAHIALATYKKEHGNDSEV